MLLLVKESLFVHLCRARAKERAGWCLFAFCVPSFGRKVKMLPLQRGDASKRGGCIRWRRRCGGALRGCEAKAADIFLRGDTSRSSQLLDVAVVYDVPMHVIYEQKLYYRK